MSGDAVLAFDDVHLSFPGPKGRIPVLRGVSFEIAAGELLGLVGESGSGKSLTCFAALGLIEAGGRITEGRILYRGEDLLAASSARRRALRGDRLAMVFQDPMSALNPFLSIATQVSEGLRAHRGHSQRAALARARELLVSCEIRDPDRVMAARPHELSGGMRQRVLLASALALEPDLLFCDEPTTALDVTTQASVLSLIDELRRRVGCSVLFVSHDLGVVSNLADRVAVMYAGRIVEEASAERIFESPRHPYTRGLLAAIPRLDGPIGDLAVIPGSPPRPGDLEPGCSFAPRCPRALPDCSRHEPEDEFPEPGHRVACPVVLEPRP